MEKRKIKNDIILIAAVLLIAAIALVCMLIFSKEGTQVVVTVDKEVYGKYPLSRDATIEIETEYGRNTLVISDGKAKISDADCPNAMSSDRCVRQNAISDTWETIICRPHGVVVSIE